VRERRVRLVALQHLLGARQRLQDLVIGDVRAIGGGVGPEPGDEAGLVVDQRAHHVEGERREVREFHGRASLSTAVATVIAQTR
jgi:hypothetical protein